MMIVIYNRLAGIPIGAAFVILLVVGPFSLRAGEVLGALALIAIDVALRVMRARQDDSVGAAELFRPSGGGQLFFVPVWAIGLVLLPYGCYDANKPAATTTTTTTTTTTPPPTPTPPTTTTTTTTTTTPTTAAAPAPRPAAPPPFCASGTTEHTGFDDDKNEAKWCQNGDVRDGPFESVYPSGDVALAGAYRNGRRTGEWVGHHKNGNVSQRATFADDVVVGRVDVFDESGAPLRDETAPVKRKR